MECSFWQKMNPTSIEAKNQLKFAFNMNNLDESKKTLRMEIHSYLEKKILWLSQCKFIQRILHRFNIGDSKQL